MEIRAAFLLPGDIIVEKVTAVVARFIYVDAFSPADMILLYVVVLKRVVDSGLA